MRLWPVALLLLVAAGVAGWFGTRQEGFGGPPPGSAASGATGRGAPGQEPAEGGTRRGPTTDHADSGAAGGEPNGVPGSYVWNERGVQALREGRLEDAVAAFEHCLELDPEEPVFARNLAEALARRARAMRADGAELASALELLARAVELAPDREDLAALLEQWRGEAAVESEFSEFGSHYFHLSFDGSRTELLDASQRFLDRLEAAYTDLREWFAHDPILAGRAPFPVRLYRREEFARVTGLGHWAAGSFDGTIRLPLEEDAVEAGGWGATLRHELVHAFVREVGGPNVPGWLHEGLAQWLEGGGARGGSTDGGSALRAARARLRGKAPIPLDQLERPLISASDPERVRQSYDQALVLVDWIAREYGESVVLEMLAGLKDGARAAEGFRGATGVELELVLRDALEGSLGGR